uniref:ATP phosphoribosyltransferase regulatory subunit n=1 Tax=Ferrovum sp. TaxID=2609467 RepID=UPI002608E315
MTYRWLLPDHLEDLLPEAAWCLEGARRLLLDTLRGRGYQLVIPPLVEFVESLAVEEGQDLGPLTFSLVDPLCGRQLGLRPDMTLQAARIDAHGMNHQGVNRLCYAGSILHTRPEGLNQSREPYQLGAEIYGLE